MSARYKVTHRKTGMVHYLTAEQLAKLPHAPVLAPTSARPLAPFPSPAGRRARGGRGSAGGVIHLRNLKDKPWTRHGKTIERDAEIGHHADIVVGSSIRLFGHDKNSYQPGEGGNSRPVGVDYNITFRVGDQAIYGGFNFDYTGTITAIGAKTVTINASSTGSRPSRLSIPQFSRLNEHYDAVAVAKRRNEWQD